MRSGSWSPAVPPLPRSRAGTPSTFSGFYLAPLLVLFFSSSEWCLFEWRAKSKSPRWRAVWLAANAIGSFGAALVWGVGLSALLSGVPLDSSGTTPGAFWYLFSAYTVFAGIAVVLFFVFHGAVFLTLRTSGDLCDRALRTARILALPAAAVAAGFMIWTVVVAVDRNDKSVFPPVLPAVLGIAAAVLAAWFVLQGRTGRAFLMTGLGTILMVATLFTSLYPRVMVSSSDFANSLTVDNASSAHYTLAVMTVVALLVLPVVLLYQGWTYHVFRHRLTGDTVTHP